MISLSLNRRVAFAFGVAISLLQAGRSVLWRSHWPQSAAGWPIFLDAYVVGALLVSGSIVARRNEIAGRLIMAAGWGFSCGILYRSFFGHLEDPNRQSGHEILILACKAALLVVSAVGLLLAVSHKREERA